MQWVHSAREICTAELPLPLFRTFDFGEFGFHRIVIRGSVDRFGIILVMDSIETIHNSRFCVSVLFSSTSLITSNPLNSAQWIIINKQLYSQSRDWNWIFLGSVVIAKRALQTTIACEHFVFFVFCFFLLFISKQKRTLQIVSLLWWNRSEFKHLEIACGAR